jgi:ABC-type antimicrobial peptide transport system permease subunit
LTIVGEVGDVKDRPDSPKAEPAFWWPEMQQGQPDMSIAIRARGNPELLADALRNEVHRLDPALAVADVQIMDKIVDSSVSAPRFAFVLVGLFASLAIMLAAIGTYGVIAYMVGRRTQEFGLRIALGAQRTDLLRMVLRESARLALPGALVGVTLTVSLGRVLSSLIYNVSPADPVIVGSVAGLVLLIALLAAYLPARRASRTDPMVSLRAE